MGAVCEYGCGREAKHSLTSKGGVKKACCSSRYQKCPAQRTKRGAISQTAHAKRRADGSTLRRHLLGKAKREAAYFGVPWKISDNLFYSLIQGVCYFCGNHGSPHNQVSRFNGFEGYTPQNCIPSCTECGLIRRSFEPEELWKRLKRILDRHPNGILHPSKAIITKLPDKLPVS